MSNTGDHTMMLEIRPFKGVEGGRCRWGDCAALGVGMRRNPIEGWLPVCQKHLLPDFDYLGMVLAAYANGRLDALQEVEEEPYDT